MLHSSDSHARSVRSCSGKFLHVGNERFLVRGVAYGTFAPRADGCLYPQPDQVRRDLAAMAACGINTVRTYTVPPPDLLDAAAAHGLYVMAGLAWPQHVAFLDDRRLARDIVRTIAAQARAIAHHPAVLLTAVGNEIPPAVVRWHGPAKVERFIRAAVAAARDAAPGMLFTYVNYPPTEFLDLPFLDVYAFNVYLHDEAAMRAYVARLQHLAGTRPLLLAECGADSQRQGEDGQAQLARMQAHVAVSEGACGAIVFGWTDEWWRGGMDIDDWSFGLVDRARRPKPALTAVSEVYAAAPFPAAERAGWPSVSVVVCAFNAAATIDDCLLALARVDYPHVEVIVVDDGSTDDTAARAQRYGGVTVIRTANGGLSHARNVGLHAARGDIVAYVDADARVDQAWLTYLVQPFLTSDAVAAGGPNVVPDDDPWFAQCVARAPGAPSHVLLDDRVAEHVPGCNMAVRRSALLAIDGFDPIFLRAGDDVDVCWRLQDRGGIVAFSPSALVWHHHRVGLRAYWRQQVGYGEGEAWLRGRHHRRFSRSGVAWRGRIYSALPFVQSLSQRRLHSGVWGTASFPTVYHTEAHPLRALPHTPEWQLGAFVLFTAGLAVLVARGVSPLALLAAVAGGAALLATLAKCALYAVQSDVERLPRIGGLGPAASRLVYRATIAWLHVVQPFARTYGYLRGSVRRPRVAVRPIAPVDAPDAVPARLPRREMVLLLGQAGERRFWSERWIAKDALLTRLVERLRAVRSGRGIDVDDGWRADRDVSVALGPWAWAHVQALVEDHGTGRCLFRARIQVRLRALTVWLAVLTLALAATLLSGGGPVAGSAAAAGSVLLLRAGRSIWRDARQIFEALGAVAADFGLLPVAVSARPAAGTTETWDAVPSAQAVER